MTARQSNYGMKCKYCYRVLELDTPAKQYYCSLECSFMGRVSIDISSGCWNWRGKIDQNNSLYFVKDGKACSAPRYAYEFYKKISAGEKTHIKRNCKNVYCVNPEHLYVAVPRVYQPRKPAKPRVSQKPLLTPQQVSAIRLDTRTIEEIAKEYNRLPVTIRRIKRGVNFNDGQYVPKQKPKMNLELAKKVRLDNRKTKIIAEEYKVSTALINMIKRNAVWKEID